MIRKEGLFLLRTSFDCNLMVEWGLVYVNKIVLKELKRIVEDSDVVRLVLAKIDFRVAQSTL